MYFFELLLDDWIDLHQTLHVASMDPPVKIYQNNCDSPKDAQNTVWNNNFLSIVVKTVFHIFTKYNHITPKHWLMAWHG